MNKHILNPKVDWFKNVCARPAASGEAAEGGSQQTRG